MGIFNKTKKNQEKDSNKEKKSANKKVSTKDLYKNEVKSVSTKVTGGTKKEKISAKDVTKKQDKKVLGDAYKILVKPLITEKAANLSSESKYVFAVSIESNKIEIAKAINEVYGIKPVAVNVIRVGGKKVRHGRVQGRRKNWKKAIVTLPKGKTINIYEGV